MALLKLSSIEKSFPGVKALDNVSFSIEKGEVIALLGENGAGKSTLIKILGGVHQQDKGCVTFQNKEVVIQNPTHAKKLGIGIIFQELNIVQSVRQSFFRK
jgi:ABC-type sugar transport system ATPase subunit